MSSERHRCLLVEDDNATSQELQTLFSALGHDAIVRTNRDDAAALLESEPVCLVILDLEIGANARSQDQLPEAGLSLLEIARRRYPEVSGTNGNTLQVIVYSAHGAETPQVHEAMQRGANAVVAKGAGAARALKGEIKNALERSGRTDHKFCGEPNRQPVIEYYYDGAQLDITGRLYRSRNEVFLNNRPLGLTNESFGLLVQLVSGRMHNHEGWVDRDALGKRAQDASYQSPSRLRKALEQYLPEGLDPVEVDGGRFRLPLRIGIRQVRWASLTGHDDALVRTAAERNQLAT